MADGFEELGTRKNPEQSLQRIKKSENVINRLTSIKEDAKFVDEIVSLLDGKRKYEVFANLRCGVWYTRNKQDRTCYFKSTDGHVGNWGFPISRSNIHVAESVYEHGAAFVVDATRSGKKFPDALSRTIPIWCAVVNRAVAIASRKMEFEKSKQEWLALHMLVEASENDYVCAEFVPKFAEKLLKLKRDEILRLADVALKPMRCLFFSQNTLLWSSKSDVPDLSTLDFTPVICISASGSVEGIERPRNYVQGAGDDEESWSRRMTPGMFWGNEEYIIRERTEMDVIRAIDSVVSSSGGDIHEKSSILGTTCITLGGRPSDQTISKLEFDYVLNVSETPDKNIGDGIKYLHLSIPDGKKGKDDLLRSIPFALDFMLQGLREGKKMLVHCDQGRNRSVAMTIAALMYADFDMIDEELVIRDRIQWGSDSISPESRKEAVQRRLFWIQRYRPEALPTRMTMKVLYRHFLA